MLGSRNEDPRRGGDITRAYLLTLKVRMSVLLWLAGVIAVLASGFLFGPLEGPAATMTYGVAALCLSMAIVRYRRAGLLDDGVPDIELTEAGLIDNQSGAGLIPWDDIQSVTLDKRRTRGAANALILLRLGHPDRYSDRLRLGRRIANIGMWPRVGNHHFIDASELDCQPEALTESIRRRLPGHG